MEDKIPEFHPTLDEMRDFSAYIKFMEDQGAHKIGVAKVIPPDEYIARRAGYGDIEDMLIENSIKQMMTGRQGAYQVLNVEQKPKTVREFRALANTKQYAPPADCADNPEELERKYWKNLGLNPPIYGADIPGTLTDADQSVWNIQKLGTILDTIGESAGAQIQGVNTAYLYFGMWKASFAWHTEDMDLYSINYIHCGKPKTWYCIPPMHADRFEKLAAQYFSGDFKHCREFLRHKMFILSPSLLKTHCIPVYKTTHREGEFMVTFPRAYHAGFNHGFNCAESTNFASERWIDFGKKASYCKCKPDTVRIEMGMFVRRYQPELWRSPTPTPSLSSSAATSASDDSDASDEHAQQRRFSKKKKQKRKRKRAGNSDTPPVGKADEELARKRLRHRTAQKKLRARLRKRRQALLQKQHAEDARVAAEAARVQALLDAVRRTNRCLAFPTDDANSDGDGQLTRVDAAVGEAVTGVRRVEGGTISASNGTSQVTVPTSASAPTPTQARCSVCMQWGKLRRTTRRAREYHGTSVVHGTRIPHNASETRDIRAHHNASRKTQDSRVQHNVSKTTQCIRETHGTNLQHGTSAAHTSATTHFTSQTATAGDASSKSSQPNVIIISDDDDGECVQDEREHGGTSDSLAEDIDSDENNPEQCRTREAPEGFTDMHASLHSSFKESNLDVTRATNRVEAIVPGVCNEPSGKWQDCSGSESQHVSEPKEGSREKFLEAVAADTDDSASDDQEDAGMAHMENSASEDGGGSVVESEDDTVENEASVIACVRCEVVVHRQCYGVSPAVRASEFLCAPCLQGSVEGRQCCLCPSPGGALKPVAAVQGNADMVEEKESKPKLPARGGDKRWAHVSCAAYIQETSFGDATACEPVCGVEKIHRLKWRLKCVVCAKRHPSTKKTVGVCIQCTRGKCTTAFHVTCAQKAGFELKLLEAEHNSPYHFEAYCVRHRPQRSGARQRSADTPTHVDVGTRILARWRSDGFWPGVVTEVISIVFCHVRFPDGSESTDVAPEFVQRAVDGTQNATDITSHGDLQCNDAVVVQWPDNQSYDGTFVKYIAEAKYAIHFDDGHRSKVPLCNIRDINDTSVKLGVSIPANDFEETGQDDTFGAAIGAASESRTTRAVKVDYRSLLRAVTGQQ